MSKISKQKRNQIERKIIEAYMKVDKTNINANKYKEKFSKMNDDEFYKFISKPFPFRFYEVPFETEVTISDIEDGLKYLNIPLLEKIHLPALYQNENGESVTTLECMTGYMTHKKVQQFITHKNSMSVDIDQRDMKTGLLTGFDKNGKSSDRELESLAVLGLTKSIEEFSKPKADAMKSKNAMYNIINTTGQVRLEDLPKDEADSLSKNLFNTYLIGAHLYSNLINNDYYLPYTLKDKKKELLRK